MKEISICLGSASAADPVTMHQDVLSNAVITNDATPPHSLERLHLTVLASELATVMNPMDLSKFMPLLKQDGMVSIHVLGGEGNNNHSDLSLIHSAFLLAGLKGASEAKQADGSRILTATKFASNGIQTVKLNLADGDNDLIDEDGLLTDASNLLAPPPAMSKVALKNGDDCGGREPCDDCTCGRADAKKKTEFAAPAQPKPIQTSSCGKCGLGDAFRCASCPYLGKPAFKPGEEHLVLDLQDDF